MTPRDIVAAARTRLARSLPYFSAPIMALRVFALEGLKTFGVDAEARMAFDPERAAEWGVEFCSTVVFHEALHINGDHFTRQGNRDHKLWNWACDIAINQIVSDAGFSWPPQTSPLLPETFGFSPNLTPEEYYALLDKSESAKQKALSAADRSTNMTGQGATFPGCGTPCGTGAGNPQGWEASAAEISSMEGMTRAQAQVMRHSTALKIKEFIRQHGASGRGCGTVPAGLEAWATLELKPSRIPWTQVLAADVRSAVSSKTGANDYIRTKTARRYWGLAAAWGTRAPLTPALHSPVPEVVLVVDTSGSMMGKPIEQALSEAIAVVKAIGCPIKAYAVDAAVQATTKLMGAQNINQLNAGGGGTNMVVGISAAEKDNPDVIILLTDGMTPFPDADHMPSCELVVGIIGNAEVPGHIRKVVRIPVDETD